MTAKFTVIGTDIKVSFEYTAKLAMVQSIVGACAEYLFEHGYGDHGTEEVPIQFGSLTNQQKLDIVDAHIRRV